MQAFTRLGLPLWDCGAGRDREALEATGGTDVKFLGYVDEESQGVGALQGVSLPRP